VILDLIANLGHAPTSARFQLSDLDIVKVYYWSAIFDRPVSWACRRENWPIHLRSTPLPSPSTMSRRLRSGRVVALLDALGQRVTAPQQPGLFWMVDGKSLQIGGCPKDRQDGYGRAAGGKAKGYKLHALIGDNGSIAAWRIATMNKDERVMARRLLKGAPQAVVGYVAADANYDSNKLHRECDNRGNLQLISPRRCGPDNGTGHRKQTAGRLRCIALTESPHPAFAQKLLEDRAEIERRFGHQTTWGGGLSSLPAW